MGEGLNTETASQTTPPVIVVPVAAAALELITGRLFRLIV